MSNSPKTLLPNKLPSDRRIISATLALNIDIAPGETITTAVWTCTPYEGVDPNAAAMISGVASINGNTTSQMVINGVIGVTYMIACTITTSLGQILTKVGYMQVTSMRELF